MSIKLQQPCSKLAVREVWMDAMDQPAPDEARRPVSRPRGRPMAVVAWLQSALRMTNDV
jgi:hypothetical protein